MQIKDINSLAKETAHISDLSKQAIC